MATEEKVKPTPTEWVPMEVTPGQTKIIIFVGFGSGTTPEQQAIHQQIQWEFNSTHDAIQIEFLTVPWPERISRFSELLAKDMAPDIVMPIGVGGITEFYDEWADLTPYILRDSYDMSRFVGKTVEIQRYPEKGILGLPMCVYPTAVFINKDIFDAASVAYPPQKFGENYADGHPWDYYKLVEIAQKMSLDVNGNDANSPAFDSKNMKQWGWEGWNWFNNIEYATKFGEEPGTIVSQDQRRSLLGTQQYRDAFAFDKDTIWTWHIRANSEQAAAYYDMSGDPFESGRVAMWEAHVWIKYLWGNWNKAIRWDVAAVPQGPNGKVVSIVDADTFVIPKSSMHKDEAWEVVKWFWQKQNLKKITDNYGCIPADRELAAGWVGDIKSKYPDINPQVFVDALDYMETDNHESWRPEYSKINEIVKNMWYEMYSGKNLDVTALLGAADQEVQALLDQYWQNQ